MTVSSRTPEGLPSRCALCGAENYLEFSNPAADAPCPSCGLLLWLSAQLLAQLQKQFAGRRGLPAERITPETRLADLGADSLDTVELVMQLEEEFHLSMPDIEAEGVKTIGDIIRWIEQSERRK